MRMKSCSMLGKLHNFVTFGLVLVVATMGIYGFIQKRSLQSKITKLHNEIALNSETIEIHKNAYEKKTAELEDLEDVLRTFESEKDKDAETIRKLRKELKDRGEEILVANRVALKWKKAYEAEAEANQTDEPTDPGSDNPGETRTRVAFNKDFGYIGVSGYTLTNPPYAWVKVQQNRPLLLTMAVTQAKDGHWSTYVTSSEDNVGVDIKLAAVNPYIFKSKWYEKFSLDFGLDLKSTLYPYAGASYPIGPVSLSAGFWADTNAESRGVDWYTTLNYSWHPFARK